MADMNENSGNHFVQRSIVITLKVKLNNLKLIKKIIYNVDFYAIDISKFPTYERMGKCLRRNLQLRQTVKICQNSPISSSF